jgi:hypothetical protein
MPFIQGLSYIVSCRRFPPTTVRNVIRVTPVPFVGAGAGVEFVDLTYNLTPTTPPTVGSVIQTPAGMRRVFGFLPEADFEVQRMLFLTATPIEIEWQTEQLVPSQLVFIEVRTQPKPIGTGPFTITS